MLKSLISAACVAIPSQLFSAHEDDEMNNSSKNFTYYSMVTMGRTTAALPFDVIGTGKQIYPGKNYDQIMVEFFKRDTLKKMVFPHTFGSALQSSYIYPLAATVPMAIEGKFPETSQSFPMFPKICLATLISGINAILVTPIEGIKVWAMTEGTTSPHLLPFYRREQGKVCLNHSTLSRDWLFKGGSLTFQSSWLHITSFLALQHYITDFVHQDKGQPLTIYEAFKVGAVISAFQSAITYPLMVLRTRIQALPTQGDRKFKGIMGLIKAANITKLSELYAGLSMRIPRSLFMTPFDAYVLGNIDQEKHKK